jgi:hypothetical protein
MADFWTDPKINWIDNDGIGYGDLNRIEANTKALRDATFRKVQGFGYSINNAVVGQDGVVTITPGSCYSENGVPIRMSAAHVKNLKTWAPGNGATFGGMAAAVTVAAHTWYYAFVIMKPSDGTTEIMFDDNPAGTNVVSGIYTEKRFIHSFKTGAAGGDGSFNLIEMYAIGDNVFINPNSMWSGPGVNHSDTSDSYSEITLTEGARGLALPARDVLAKLNVVTEKEVHSIGLISAYGGHFSVPTTFINAGVRVGEFVFQSIIPVSSDHNYGVSCDCDIMIPSNGKINIAYLYDTSSPELWVAVRGYFDDRSI